MFSSDSCLQGCGGFWKGAFFSQFPREIMEKNLHITALEFLSKIVGKNFRGQRLLVLCDNMSACQIINTGSVTLNLTVFNLPEHNKGNLPRKQNP